MRLYIKTVGDLIRELQKYPPYAPIYDKNGKEFEEIKYENKIPFYDLSKCSWDSKEGFKLI